MNTIQQKVGEIKQLQNELNAQIFALANFIYTQDEFEKILRKIRQLESKICVLGIELANMFSELEESTTDKEYLYALQWRVKLNEHDPVSSFSIWKDVSEDGDTKYFKTIESAREFANNLPKQHGYYYQIRREPRHDDVVSEVFQ